MSIRKKKISELPVSDTLLGISVLGVNKQGKNVQADLSNVDRMSTEAIPTLAHTDCTLDQRVSHLEQLISDLISGREYIPSLRVRDLEVWGKDLGVLTGTGAPTRSPDKAGQFYVDTQNRVLYFATGNTSIADWK